MKNLLKAEVAKSQCWLCSDGCWLLPAAVWFCCAEAERATRAKAKNKRFFFIMRDTLLYMYMNILDDK